MHEPDVPLYMTKEYKGINSTLSRLKLSISCSVV